MFKAVPLAMHSAEELLLSFIIHVCREEKVVILCIDDVEVGDVEKATTSCVCEMIVVVNMKAADNIMILEAVMA